MQLGGRAERPLSRDRFGDTPPSLIVDVALNAQGFVVGEALGSGIVARAGVGIPLRR